MSNSKTTNRPKDVGAKFATKKGALLESMAENLERELLQDEISLEINASILNIVNKMIDKEKEKFK